MKLEHDYVLRFFITVFCCFSVFYVEIYIPVVEFVKLFCYKREFYATIFYGGVSLKERYYFEKDFKS